VNGIWKIDYAKTTTSNTSGLNFKTHNEISIFVKDGTYNSVQIPNDPKNITEIAECTQNCSRTKPNTSLFGENFNNSKIPETPNNSITKTKLSKHEESLAYDAVRLLTRKREFNDTFYIKLGLLCANYTDLTKDSAAKQFLDSNQSCLQLIGGNSTKIFYKGYYYKIRTEKKKSFIVTKNEGQVSVSTVNKWRSKHEKQLSKQKKDKQNKK
jgi:hypothetical protein